MSEALVCLVSKVNDDPYLDAKCLKRGDVIVVVEDGHQWGRDELANPDWRIVKVKATVEQMRGLLAPEPATDPAAPNRMLQRRAFALDLDKLQDGMTFAKLPRIRRAPRADPNVID